MESELPSPEEIALRYLDQLPWTPYPFQEQAILAWFEGEDGILICAPTGTGKTVIAETALFEALMTGRQAYYTTPLIALTEQKFHDLQDSAERWGFSRNDVGLVTGNRRVNPDAQILVVVAEILLNRLLSPEEFSFDNVSAVVMDEFHNFNDPERGIVWELSLGMLPKRVRVLLISATVGNAPEFVVWLNKQHNRRLRLLQSDERRVPLSFRWVIDELLSEQLEIMADGDDDEARYTPALVFCFNRSECWSVAEQLKGRRLLASGQQKQLQIELDQMDWSLGAGGKLKQILIRGVGIHHAGLLPKYRRAVESLFQKKLLSVCICTETLAAGINLPARSVVMTSLIKGPPRAMKLIDASSAHQMFGRAGRPQFDDQGYVFAVAHEDDVKLHRWQQKYDQIPEDTKDPMLRRAKKKLKKKMPKRRSGQQYWTEKQFETLRGAAPGKLASRGRFPWRLLAFLIRKSGSVYSLQDAIRRRLLDTEEKEDAEKTLKRMLITLDAGGFITLSPKPPHRQTETETSDESPVFRSRIVGGGVALALDDVQDGRSVTTSVWGSGLTIHDDGMGDVIDFGSKISEEDPGFGLGVFEDEATVAAAETNANTQSEQPEPPEADDDQADADDSIPAASPGLLGQLIQEAKSSGGTASTSAAKKPGAGEQLSKPAAVDQQQMRLDEYEPQHAIATPQLEMLFAFRSINSVYAIFLAEHMHRASYEERLQLLEAALNMPRSVGKSVRVPFPDKMPHGPLTTEYADGEVLRRGLATQEELTGYRDEVTGRRIPPLELAQKMHMLFRSDFPNIHDARSTSIWCIGDLLQFGGDFNKYVRARDLTKQEGIIFRHCLRMILLCGEFAQIEPPEIDPVAWRSDLAELAALLTDSCRAVDPASTDDTLTALESRKLDPEQLVM
ncbi:MAG TPA: DEAD/DEAH box helicase [Planctomycetes bacterium]|nr:DEAD/DEAH box helicase [Fuerstiella sp.]HIK94920.1 DEAD/DEAH box helicase [Planctomycetota bacterium]